MSERDPGQPDTDVTRQSSTSLVGAIEGFLAQARQPRDKVTEFLRQVAIEESEASRLPEDLRGPFEASWDQHKDAYRNASDDDLPPDDPDGIGGARVPRRPLLPTGTEGIALPIPREPAAQVAVDSFAPRDISRQS